MKAGLSLSESRSICAPQSHMSEIACVSADCREQVIPHEPRWSECYTNYANDFVSVSRADAGIDLFNVGEVAASHVQFRTK